MSTEEGKPKAKLKYAVPKKVGAAIDLLYKVRAERKALQAKMEAEKAQETLIEEKILSMFGKQDLEGARGRAAQCSVSRKDSPTIEDFDALWDYARKKNLPELLHRRVSSDAVRERWKNGETIPGVGVFTKVSLSLTKIK